MTTWGMKLSTTGWNIEVPIATELTITRIRRDTFTILTATVLALDIPGQGSRFGWAVNQPRQEPKIIVQASSTLLVEQIRRAIGESA